MPRSAPAWLVLPILAIASPADGGGGPANVLVLYNAEDPEAVAVAEHYRDLRSVPAAQLCGLASVDPAAQSIGFDDYVTYIGDPLDACLESLPQPEEIDYVVTVRGLPYRVDIPDGFTTSLEAMIQVLHTYAPSTGEEIAGRAQYRASTSDPYQASIVNPHAISGSIHSGDYTISNPSMSWYTASPGIVRAAELPESFRREMPAEWAGFDFSGNLLVVTRLDGFDYDDATALVDRAVASDASFPTAEILCMEASDQARGARDPECEFVVRHLVMAGLDATYLSPFDGALSGHTVAAYFTGTAGLTGGIAGNTYVPGAIACNLTSFGAAPQNFLCSPDGSTCPASESQTSIARFVAAGATGAHGTVNEPLNNSFPNAGTLLLYTFGYNLGESFFLNQRFLYWQNLVLGDPLATPYAERPTVTVTPGGSVPSLSTLTVQGSHPDGVARVILYVDGARVAQADSDTLEHVVTDPEGTDLHILAVAIASNAPVTRTGWPVAEQHPRPDVQGWTTATIAVTTALEPDEVEVTEPVPDSAPDAEEDVPADTAGDPGPGREDSACGCSIVS